MILSPIRLKQILGTETADIYIAFKTNHQVIQLLNVYPTVFTWNLADPEAATAAKVSLQAASQVAISVLMISQIFETEIIERDLLIAQLRGKKFCIETGETKKPTLWKRFLSWLNKL